MARETVLLPRDPVCRKAIELFLESLAREGFPAVRAVDSQEGAVRLEEFRDTREVTIRWKTEAEITEAEDSAQWCGEYEEETAEEGLPGFSAGTLSALEETLQALARNVEAARFFVRRFAGKSR